MNEKPQAPGLSLSLVDDIAIFEPNAQEPLDESAADDGKEPKGTKAQRDFLIDIGSTGEVYCDSDSNPYITLISKIGEKTHKQNHKLRSAPVERHFTQCYYEKYQGVPSAQAQEDAFRVLEARAASSQIVHEPKLRSALSRDQTKIFIDPGTPSWEVIEVSNNGHRVIPESAVKFVRTRGLLPMVLPLKQTDALKRFRALLNFSGSEFDQQWTLLMSCLVAGLHPIGPYPILILIGEQGTGKSTIMRMLRKLIDPSKAPVRSPPVNESDLVLTAENNWTLSYDNLSGMTKEISDALCRVSTGSGFSKRALYTDGDEVIFNVQRFVMLNGIDELTTRGDLLDRAVVIHLPVIPETDRKTEQELWQEFEAIQPGIFHALLNGLSAILKNQSTIKLAKLPRMADFALKATAAETALGLTPGAFMRAYEGNREEAVEAGMEASPVTQLVLRVVESRAGRFQGKASQLFEEIMKLADSDPKKSNQLPHGPKGISDALRRNAPIIRKSGYEITFTRKNKERQILIEREPSGVDSNESDQAEKIFSSEKS